MISSCLPMPQKKKYGLCLVLLFLIATNLCAQEPLGDPAPVIEGNDATLAPTDADNSASFTIREIIITGNRKTRDNIILREVPFRSGEKYSLQELVRKFEDARRQLMNTSLFHDVVVSMLKTEDYLIDVSVQVRERWYIFPVPYFKPVDRNLNQWLFEKNASLSRVNYGVKILHNNATGRQDKFRLFLIGGYTQQFSFTYDRLYIDKQMKFGLAT